MWRHSPVTTAWPETRGNVQGIGRFNDNISSRFAEETVLLCAMKTYRRTTDTVLLAVETQPGYNLWA